MTTELPTLPNPEITPSVAHFWEAAGEGKLDIRHCRSCNELHHYPRSFCPFCYSDDLDWQTVSGKGTVYSFSVMRRAPVPFAIAYVTLEEGPTILSHIVRIDLDDIAIGQKVQVAFADTQDDGPKVPVFEAAS
ncbi:Zn-ribbon domain-containing OB-fold protein [Aurantiacibacter zhengii]|uniref:Zn-ribbon domain-containing OB-fold protein n=1 Tax=Aurantiacibacter zhengii TaxID=2307003 RepID=A0A418NT98_9SPHN|nr:Zn-ribbon domain-containing OB-fold protein [Aurantiacibacter zhengii]RIV86809.1 Zn-ribbon domain-containing OB-fold protein [Aurantiacibacter zhengii]